MLIQIILLFLLIGVNGLFSASEIAFLSMNKGKISDKSKKDKKIKKLLDNPSGFLATIQIGITLAGFLASAFAAEAFADQIVSSISTTYISRTFLKSIVVVIVTIILSYFTLVLGELVPKRIAMNAPEKVAYAMVNTIYLLMKVAYPFVWFLTKSTNIITKLLNIKPKEDEKVTEEQIRLMIADGMNSGAIEPGEKILIDNIFRFNDICIKDIMTKREDIVAIDVNMSKDAVLKIVKDSKYTRIPVYEDKLDNIIGVFNVKDIIHKYSPDNKRFNLREILNPAMYVNDTDILDDVFRLMQKSRKELSIVINNQSRVCGVVTIEDALEEIVGNIFDEYD